MINPEGIDPDKLTIAAAYGSDTLTFIRYGSLPGVFSIEKTFAVSGQKDTGLKGLTIGGVCVA